MDKEVSAVSGSTLWNSLPLTRGSHCALAFLKTVLYCRAYETLPYYLRDYVGCKDCCTDAITYLLTYLLISVACTVVPIFVSVWNDYETRCLSQQFTRRRHCSYSKELNFTSQSVGILFILSSSSSSSS